MQWWHGSPRKAPARNGARDDHPATTPVAGGLKAFGRCLAGVVESLRRRRLRQPSSNIGRVIAFADGTRAAVYRETVLHDGPVTEPAGSSSASGCGG